MSFENTSWQSSEEKIQKGWAEISAEVEKATETLADFVANKENISLQDLKYKLSNIISSCEEMLESGAVAETSVFGEEVRDFKDSLEQLNQALVIEGENKVFGNKNEIKAQYNIQMKKFDQIAVSDVIKKFTEQKEEFAKAS